MYVANLYHIDEKTIGLAFLLGLMLVSELAYQVGRRLAPQVGSEVRGQISTVETAVLGLLGLFLAFTFSMAAERFDARRQMVVDQSNAIGTAYLRCEMLSEPLRSQLRAIIRSYVEVQLELYTRSVDARTTEVLRGRVDRLQNQLWEGLAAQARLEPQSIVMGLVVSSFNALIDIDETRTIGQESRVPDILFLLLMAVGLVAMGTVGYTFGLHRNRRPIVLLMLSLLIALIVVTIIDLDRPHRGLIRVSQQSMLDLKAGIAEPPPPR